MQIPAIGAWLRGAGAEDITPALLFFREGVSVLCLMITALVMARIENRTFADYGLPASEVFGKRFWQGVPSGFLMLTMLMALIAAFQGFTIGGVALRSTQAVRYGILYFFAFLLVAIFEEFSFRGYMQATLTSGIGFWPAAILLAVAFGAAHLGNSGEAVSGAVMVGVFGLVMAFSLRRTGSLWFALGLHASWDWGETYLYSVPDSGLMARGHLLNSVLHGAPWLTGGSVGPEGSLFVFPVLALAAVGIHFLFPATENSL
jgi:membrane protease YdiL (CAAX protease family)